MIRPGFALPGRQFLDDVVYAVPAPGDFVDKATRQVDPKDSPLFTSCKRSRADDCVPSSSGSRGS